MLLRYCAILGMAVVAVAFSIFVLDDNSILAQLSRDPEMIQFDSIIEFIAFENRMKQSLDMPITPVNYETGRLEPTKQLTTDYTRPIFHENQTDTRIVAFIDDNADRRNETVINKTTAESRGWVFDEGIP